MGTKTQLYKIPVPSTDFTIPAYFDGQGVCPTIRFGYKVNGREEHFCIAFSKVAAMRKRAERCCTQWHIEGAYDTLVEVESSAWVQEIRADTQAMWRDKWAMHHYMIYLDSAGCFEIVAESWAGVSDPPSNVAGGADVKS
jgi:hypothetical protein